MTAPEKEGTPRTDEMVGITVMSRYVPADFARQLERELATLRAELEEQSLARQFEAMEDVLLAARHDASGERAESSDAAKFSYESRITHERLRAESAEARYEYVRRLNVQEFAELYGRHLRGEGAFVDLVDAALAQKGGE